jgi:hypothetical protein
MSDKLSPEERAVLAGLETSGKAFVFVKDHATADRLANRGLVERKRVIFANVPLFRLNTRAAAKKLARHGR